MLSASIAMARVCNHPFDFMSFLPRIRLRGDSGFPQETSVRDLKFDLRPHFEPPFTTLVHEPCEGFSPQPKHYNARSGTSKSTRQPIIGPS